MEHQNEGGYAIEVHPGSAVCAPCFNSSSGPFFARKVSKVPTADTHLYTHTAGAPAQVTSAHSDNTDGWMEFPKECLKRVKKLVRQLV